MSALSVARLSKAFDDHPVLRGIDLSLARGTLLALLGPSGSGKTTLLRILCGFEHADRGTIDIEGRRVVDDDKLHVPPEQRRIGYVAQEGALFPHLSVAQNIVFGMARSQRRVRHRVDELLELVGLPASYGDRRPQALSGGQQQRIALARALAPAPTLVMLDEPFSSLDASLRLETRQAVADALAATHATAVLVTHDQAEALSLGREVAVLWNGSLVQTAAPVAVYRQPATREVAALVGEAVLLPGRIDRDTVCCGLGRLPLMSPVPGERVDVLVRPEQIRLLPPSTETVAEQQMPRAIVQAVTFFGHDASVRLRLERDAHDSALSPSDGPALIHSRVASHLAPNTGAIVMLAVEGSVHAYPSA